MTKRLDEAGGLTVADVTHSRITAFPASATVAELRAWFESSTSHRMALLAADDQYAGSLMAEDVAGADDAALAVDFATHGQTVRPDEPASRAEELALGATDTRRVPVVDADGRLHGIVAITTDLQGFCGT